VGCATVDLLPLRTRVSLAAGVTVLLAATVGIEALRRASSRVVRVAVLAAVVLLGALPAAAIVADSPPPYRAEEMRPVLETVAEKRRPDDEIWVYRNARHALDVYGPRAGLEAWDQSRGHTDDPRAHLRELDHFRGRERVWILFSHVTSRDGELELLRAYLEAIGRFVEVVPDPYGLTGERAAGAWLVDLSDPVRLRSATAGTFEPGGAGASGEDGG